MVIWSRIIYTSILSGWWGTLGNLKRWWYSPPLNAKWLARGTKGTWMETLTTKPLGKPTKRSGATPSRKPHKCRQAKTTKGRKRACCEKSLQKTFKIKLVKNFQICKKLIRTHRKLIRTHQNIWNSLNLLKSLIINTRQIGKRLTKAYQNLNLSKPIKLIKETH